MFRSVITVLLTRTVENQCAVRDLGGLELLVQAFSSKHADTLKAAAWALLRASHQGEMLDLIARNAV